MGHVELGSGPDLRECLFLVPENREVRILAVLLEVLLVVRLRIPALPGEHVWVVFGGRPRAAGQHRECDRRDAEGRQQRLELSPRHLAGRRQFDQVVFLVFHRENPPGRVGWTGCSPLWPVDPMLSSNDPGRTLATGSDGADHASGPASRESPSRLPRPPFARATTPWTMTRRTRPESVGASRCTRETLVSGLSGLACISHQVASEGVEMVRLTLAAQAWDVFARRTRVRARRRT